MCRNTAITVQLEEYLDLNQGWSAWLVQEKVSAYLDMDSRFKSLTGARFSLCRKGRSCKC